MALFLEKFTPLAKILHCRRQWRHWQISPLTGCAASQNDVKWLRPGWSGLTSSKLSHWTQSSHLRCWSWSRCKWWQFEKLFLLLVSFLGGLCWTTCYWAILQLNRKDLFSVHYQMIFVFNQFHICKVQRNENCRCKFALLIFSTRNEYQEIWAAGYFALSPAQYFSCRMMSRTRLQFDSAFLQSAQSALTHWNASKFFRSVTVTPAELLASTRPSFLTRESLWEPPAAAGWQTETQIHCYLRPSFAASTPLP